MGPYTIVVQGAKSVEGHREGDNFLLSYTLPWSLLFTEQHFARLNYVGGYDHPLLVFADFVELQHVNGLAEGFLGCSAKTAVNGWVPLARNLVSSLGFLHVRPTNRATPGNLKNKLTIVIEVASATWLNGTPCSSEL